MKQRTREDFDNSLLNLAHNWLNGELSTDHFQKLIMELCENSPYSAIVIGAFLQKHSPNEYENFINSFWNYVND